MRHKCFESATLIHGDPLFYSFVIVLYDRTIGQSERRTGDSFVVSSSGWIRIEILNDRLILLLSGSGLSLRVLGQLPYPVLLGAYTGDVIQLVSLHTNHQPSVSCAVRV